MRGGGGGGGGGGGDSAAYIGKMGRVSSCLQWVHRQGVQQFTVGTWEGCPAAFHVYTYMY